MKQAYFILLNYFFCNIWILISILVIYSCYRTCESQIKNDYYYEAANLYDLIKNINA